MPVFPRRICSEIMKDTTIGSAVPPLLALCIAGCFLHWEAFSAQGIPRAAVVPLIFLATIGRLFFSALSIHVIAVVFKSSAGLKNIFICMVYAFLFPCLFELLIKASGTELLLFVPKILLFIYILPVAISAVNNTGFFRALSFYSFLLLLNTLFLYVFQILNLYPDSSISFQSYFRPYIFSAYVAIALIFALMVVSLIVDFIPNRILKSAAMSLGSILLLMNICNWTMIFYVTETLNNPVNLACDYYVIGDTIYFSSITDGLRVAECDLTKWKCGITKKFEIDGITDLTADSKGNLYLVNQADNITVYEYKKSGTPVFSIDNETHGCESRYQLIGNNFVFGGNGDFTMGCYSGEMQRYSIDGEKKSAFLIESEDMETRVSPEENIRSPLMITAFTIDKEGNYFVAFSSGIIKKVNPGGETLDVFKYESGKSMILDIVYSESGNVYALFVSTDKDAGRQKIFIRGIDVNGNIVSETIVYEGKAGDSPNYLSLRLADDDDFVLEIAGRSFVSFREYAVINKSGEVKSRIPKNPFLQNTVARILDYIRFSG